MFDNLTNGRGVATIAFKKAQFFLNKVNRITGQTYRIVLDDKGAEPKPEKKSNPVKEDTRKNND